MSEAFDEMHDFPLVETDFGRLAEKVLSRRGFLSGGWHAVAKWGDPIADLLEAGKLRA